MQTQIDQAKAAADLRIIYCLDNSVTVVAREGLSISGRGIKHRHGRTYDLTSRTLDSLRSAYSIVTDF